MRKAVCKECGSVLVDAEEMDSKPDFHHPKGSTCIHAGCYPPRDSYKTFFPKKYRRAFKRGLKLVRKLKKQKQG